MRSPCRYTHPFPKALPACACVAAAEGFDATEEEIQKEINDLAAEYNMEVSQVSALLSPEILKHDITMKKAVEVITSTAKVK